MENAAVDGIQSLLFSFAAGAITRGIGITKIGTKISNGNYAGKKMFLNKLAGSPKSPLATFNPTINKTKSVLGFIWDKAKLSGLSRAGALAAGEVVGHVVDSCVSITQSIINQFV